MLRKIRINPEARIATIPKELIDQGFAGDVDGYANAVTLTLVKPGADLAAVKRSLQIVLEDIALRQSLEK